MDGAAEAWRHWERMWRRTHLGLEGRRVWRKDKDLFGARRTYPVDRKPRKLIIRVATDVSEVAPTSDQLNSILEYVGQNKVGTVVADATSVTDAIKKFKASEQSFTRPITVDWNNGRAGMYLDTRFEAGAYDGGYEYPDTFAVIGDNESEILSLIRSLPKETNKV